MINASSLSPRTLIKEASKALSQALRQEEREPWLAAALKASARERLMRLLGSDNWLIFAYTSEDLARGWCCRSIGLKALRLGCNVVAYRNERDRWQEHLQGWEEQGLCWCYCAAPQQVPSRAAIWIQSPICPESGALYSTDLHPSVAVCADWGDRIALQPADELLWRHELANAAIHLIPLSSIAGAMAPTLLLIRRDIAGSWPELIEVSEQSSAGSQLMSAAAILDEWSKQPDDGFEVARLRAAVENILRQQVSATVLEEPAERAPHISGLIIPGVNHELVKLLFEQHGIHCRLASGKVVAPGMTIVLAGRTQEWQAILNSIALIADAIQHAQRISAGCRAWPITATSEPDPHLHCSDVRRKSTRPLYAGLIRPEHTMDGLRRVEASVRAIGVEMYLQLLIDEEDGSIADAAYQAMGAPTVIALGESLCELLIRKTHREAQLLRAAAIEENLFGERSYAEGIAKQWSNLWLEALEECCHQAADIECPEPTLETPFSAEGLTPGEPYPGWDEMINSARITIIEQCLDAEVRPYIALDAGGIEVLDLHELTLKIRYSGTCTSCPSSIGTTLRAIQQTLQARIHPELTVEPQLDLKS